MKKSFFFLHYGPGGNCDAERSYFGDLPFKDHFYFWDQPATKTFDELLDATAEEFERYTRNNQCLGIVGHSFGCDLAAALMKYLSIKKIAPADLIFIAPIPNLISAFKNLGQRVARQNDLHADVRAALQEKLLKLSKATNNVQALWDFVFTIYGYPNVGRLFWSNAKAFENFVGRSSAFRAVDLATWQSVLTDYIQNHKAALSKESLASFASKTKVYVGEEDPYLDAATGATFWNKILVAQNVMNVSLAGHHPHLEKPSNFFKFLGPIDDK